MTSAIKFLLILIITSSAIFASPPCQHAWGKWYKQAQMFYLPEQAAHVCQKCGSFQNTSGRFMELVKGDAIPGGQGTLTIKEAQEQLDAEVAKDFPTPESYKFSPAEDRYGKVISRISPGALLRQQANQSFEEWWSRNDAPEESKEVSRSAFIPGFLAGHSLAQRDSQPTPGPKQTKPAK